MKPAELSKARDLAVAFEQERRREEYERLLREALDVRCPFVAPFGASEGTSQA